MMVTKNGSIYRRRRGLILHRYTENGKVSSHFKQIKKNPVISLVQIYTVFPIFS
jgi:hypothetical protein